MRFVFIALPLLGVVVAVWLWGLLAERAGTPAFDPGMFMLGLGFFMALVLAGTSAYLAWCAVSMRYILGPDHLSIICGGVKHIVPYSRVLAVHAPDSDDRPGDVRLHGLAAALPGYVVAGGKSKRLGQVISVATVPADRQVLVVTPGVTFGLSPADSRLFIAQLEERQEGAIISGEGGGGEAEVHTQYSGPSAWGMALWRDRPVRTMLLGGLLLNAVLFGYLSVVYAGLPDRLPLHWNTQGEVDVIGDPVELLRLPVFALAVWLFNALIGREALKRERAATLFLLGGAIAAAVVFAAGVASIVTRAS